MILTPPLTAGEFFNVGNGLRAVPCKRLFLAIITSPLLTIQGFGAKVKEILQKEVRPMFVSRWNDMPLSVNGSDRRAGLTLSYPEF